MSIGLGHNNFSLQNLSNNSGLIGTGHGLNGPTGIEIGEQLRMLSELEKFKRENDSILIYVS